MELSRSETQDSLPGFTAQPVTFTVTPFEYGKQPYVPSALNQSLMKRPRLSPILLFTSCVGAVVAPQRTHTLICPLPSMMESRSQSLRLRTLLPSSLCQL